MLSLNALLGTSTKLMEQAGEAAACDRHKYQRHEEERQEERRQEQEQRQQAAHHEEKRQRRPTVASMVSGASE
jgi:hypothetical protein